MLTPSLGVLGRGEYRDAFVWLGDRARLRDQVVARDGGCAGCSPRAPSQGRVPAERRVRRRPADRNDVFTSSLVMGF